MTKAYATALRAGWTTEELKKLGFTSSTGKPARGGAREHHAKRTLQPSRPPTASSSAPLGAGLR